ncbi:MAG: hypothetical protein PWP23_1961 [Candidatus Sumerlaeota bacterium]|nr:hypothetical protein [Candidatus Sumerlaeota bacterium]
MNHEQKIEQLEKLLAIESEANDPLTHFLLGREYLEAERPADAVGAFERCIALNPHYTAAYRFLGDSHRAFGANAHAREAYEIGIGVASETGDMQAGKEMQALLRRLE